MFDPYVWNCVDGSLYIARESYLLGKRREQEERTPMLHGAWSGTLVLRRAAFDLRTMKVEGEA